MLEEIKAIQGNIDCSAVADIAAAKISQKALENTALTEPAFQPLESIAAEIVHKDLLMYGPSSSYPIFL
jgi:hypothetical protein